MQPCLGDWDILVRDHTHKKAYASINNDSICRNGKRVNRIGPTSKQLDRDFPVASCNFPDQRKTEAILWCMSAPRVYISLRKTYCHMHSPGLWSYFNCSSVCAVKKRITERQYNSYDRIQDGSKYSGCKKYIRLLSNKAGQSTPHALRTFSEQNCKSDNNASHNS